MAEAQDHPSRSLVPSDYPRWDISGTIGFLSAKTSELERVGWSGYEGKVDYHVHVGRYWTTHLKTDIDIGATNAWDDVIPEPLPVPTPPRGGFSYIYVHRRQYVAAPAVTYQFRENTFMHPYLSIGVRVALLREHRVREMLNFPATDVIDGLPPINERRATVQGRPFVGGGFKSYFNRVVFVRSDGQLAFGGGGVAVAALHAGIGVDF
jgi:hypothetical protein